MKGGMAGREFPMPKTSPGVPNYALARLNPVNSAAEASNSTGFALAVQEQGRGLRRVVSHPLR